MIKAKLLSLLNPLLRSKDDINLGKIDWKVGDLRIHIVQNDILMQQIKTPLYISVPVVCNIDELKKRIHGLTHLPISRLCVYYLGTYLSDNDTIPSDAFEDNKYHANEDIDIFKPRLHVILKPLDDEDDNTLKKEAKNEILVDEKALAAELARIAAEEKAALAKKLEEERKERKAQRKLEKRELNMYLAQNKFDLANDMEKINCKEYAQVLKEAGYWDEGAFSVLTYEILRGLHIPMRACQRIIPLSEAIKSRLDVMNGVDNYQKLIEKELLNSNILQKVGFDGLDGSNFVTKKDAYRAWENKMKEEARLKAIEDAREKVEEELDDDTWEEIKAKREKRSKPPPKEHDPVLQAKIDKIRWIEQRDDLDMPVNKKVTHKSKFCCEKHMKNAHDMKLEFIKEHRITNTNEIKGALISVDKKNSGFVSRAVLKAIAKQIFKSNRYFDFPDNDLEQLLDDSLMDHNAQLARVGWNTQLERMAKLYNVSVILYDTEIFLQQMVDTLEQLDIARYL